MMTGSPESKLKELLLASPCARAVEDKDSGMTTTMMGFPEGKLKELLIACARAVEDKDRVAVDLMVTELRKLVSVSGDPFQRLGAYVLEGLVARIASSGYSVYKAWMCKETASPELLSHRYFLQEACAYFKFGYMSANGAIAEVLKGEDMIHIIDFSMDDGAQWVILLQALGARPGGPPTVRITGIDDVVSARSRDSKLEFAERRLSGVAGQCNVPFEFHAVATSVDQVEEGHLGVIPGVEAVVVNFSFKLNNISNRDRILRLVKSLSPKVVAVVEQESNTNSVSFSHRFLETLDCYATIFDSLDLTFPRDSDNRINVEYYLAKEIVNLIACEGAERVERHELFVEWKARLVKAGFTPVPLSSLVNSTIRTVLQSYCSSYYLCDEERDGVLYLGWKDRPLVVTSAWR